MSRELNSIISNGYRGYVYYRAEACVEVERGWIPCRFPWFGRIFLCSDHVRYHGGKSIAGRITVANIANTAILIHRKSRHFPEEVGCDMPDKICPVCGKKLVKDGFDIPFETFLGFKGNKEPDIDLNFSGEYQSKAHDYTVRLFSVTDRRSVPERLVHLRIRLHLDISKIIMRSAESTRGTVRLTVLCRDVSASGERPDSIREVSLFFRWARRSNTFTPVQHPANDMTTATVTTHFDYHSIDHNLLKLDILGHDDPTMIRMLQDLTGLDPTDDPFGRSDRSCRCFMNTSALGVEPEDINGMSPGML